MDIHFHGSTTPGDILTVEATNGDDSPLIGAEIIVNGRAVEMTDENGHAKINVPNRDELNLEVHTETAEIDIYQQSTTANTNGTSEIDIEIEATDNGAIQSTTYSQSTSTSSRSSNSSIKTSTNISVGSDK